MLKLASVPKQLVWFEGGEITTIGFVSTTVTFWLHCALLLQPSIAAHVRVASNELPQWPIVLVTVLTTTIVMFVPLLSVAVGASKVHAVLSSTVLLVLLQLMIGGVVSTTVTV